MQIDQKALRNYLRAIAEHNHSDKYKKGHIALVIKVEFFNTYSEEISKMSFDYFETKEVFVSSIDDSETLQDYLDAEELVIRNFFVEMV